MTTFIVDVEREGDQLLADVQGLPEAHTYAADFSEPSPVLCRSYAGVSTGWCDVWRSA